MQIHIHKDGQQYGPYSEEEISNHLRDGTLSATDLAWYEGCADWTHISNVPGISPRPSLPPAPPPAPPPSGLTPVGLTKSKHSEVIGYSMLAVAGVAALLIWQSGNLGLPPLAFSVVAIIATAILSGIEAKQLGMGSDADKTPKGKKRTGPVSWVAVMLLLWIIGFPAYLYSRSRYGVRNLLLPGIIVAFGVLVAPFMANPPLPAVDAPEVVALAESAIRESPALKLTAGMVGSITISNPGEISFDKHLQKRVARAQLMTNLGSEVIYYTVEWQNRSKGIIWVQIRNAP